FSLSDQRVALQLLDAMSQSDGEVSVHERELHDELVTYFQADPTLVAPPEVAPTDMLHVGPPAQLPLATFTHPLLDAIELPYSTDPATLHGQLASDYNLVCQAITVWERQRARGNGRLLGVTDVG